MKERPECCEEVTMITVVRVKLRPTPAQKDALASTLRRCNEAATMVASRAFEERTYRRQSLQRLTYYNLKSAGLSAQPALHVIRKVADAYTTLHANVRNGRYGKPESKRRVAVTGKPIVFRDTAAQPYDDRCLSWQHDKQTVSIWSVEGRLKDIPFTGRKEDLERVREYRKGETDLVEHQGEFYLVATVDEPTPATFEPRGFLGVDLGVTNIAATSDEVLYSGKRLNRKRLHYLNKRKELQKKGTKSARRRLRARSQKEARFARDTNHVISKKIVAVAERTGRGIGLEELTGIRERARSRKPQRARLHSWAFAQLGQYITYKAERAGVPVVFVDPAYTSQECHLCHHIDRKNRRTQDVFACISCGVTLHADINAGKNISSRAEIHWGSINGPCGCAVLQPRDAGRSSQPVMHATASSALQCRVS